MTKMFLCSLLFLYLLKPGVSFGQDSLNYITSGQTKIDVKVNESFTIKLRACHSCGYHWYLQDIDTSNVRLIGVTYKNISENRAGGDAFEFWKFTWVKVGTYNLEFIMKGPAREYRVGGRCNFELWVNV